MSFTEADLKNLQDLAGITEFITADPVTYAKVAAGTGTHSGLVGASP